ncbi:MAG: DUF748 domain-containing protein [Halioglobus sp.]
MKRFLRYLGYGYAIYLGLTFLLILPLLNTLPAWWVEREYGRQLRSELVVFNPFTFALRAQQVKLSEPNGDDFLSFGLAEVNLSTASLWRRGWVLDRLALQELSAGLRLLPSGELNIADLAGNNTEEVEEPARGAVPGVTISSLKFSANSLRYTDETRVKPYTTELRGLQFSVSSLSTIIAEGRPYQLEATAEAGGKLSWEGLVSLPDATSSGRLELSNVSVRNAWRFIEPWAAFEVMDGRLAVAGDYSINWADELAYSINDAEVALTDLRVTPQEPATLPDTFINLTALGINRVTLDSQQQSVTAAGLTVDGLALGGTLTDDEPSLAKMMVVSFPEASAPPPTTEEESAPWSLRLKQAQVKNSSVTMDTPYTEPSKTRVSDINVSTSALQWPPAGDTRVDGGLTINKEANLRFDGSIALADGVGAFNYALENFKLDRFTPNLPTVLNATIVGGATAIEGNVTLSEFLPQQVALDGNIGELTVVIREEENSISGWQKLSWQNLIIDIPARTVNMQELYLQNYSGRLHIKEDGSINTQNLVQEELAAEAASEPPPDPNAPTWEVNIPSIQVADSALDFMDESLPIRFRTVIGELTGEITGVSTNPNSKVNVDLEGSVDGYAPVVLNGSAQPFLEAPAVDLRLTFDGVDLARLTPYSSTYAGYAIDRGLLNLDVTYGLENNQLAGNNSIIISQLKLGDRVESDKAVDLPIQLALALLTDSNGVIDLAVPVSGDVDDPKFSIGSVIAGAIVNLITKAVTAPFTLLANLVGSDDDLQTVTYPSGLSEPDDAAKAKLATLADAMSQRPELKLVITGRLHPSADRDKLAARQLQQSLLDEGISQQQIDERGDAWKSAIRTRFNTLGAADSSTETAEELTATQQEAAIRGSIVVPEEALKALASERAASAKRHLVTELQLEADRAVIELSDTNDEKNLFSGIEMSVDT